MVGNIIEMGRLFKLYLNDAHDSVGHCKECNTHVIAKKDTKVLVGMDLHVCYDEPINVYSVPSPRFLTSTIGTYSFVDIYCNCCELHLGWRLETPSNTIRCMRTEPFIFLFEDAISFGIEAQ